MKLRIFIMVCLLAVWLTGTAFAQVTTHTVDTTQFETSKGEILSTCDNTSDWRVIGTGANISNDTTYYMHGNGSVKLTAVNGVTGTAKLAINHNFADDRNIIIWIYVDNVSTIDRLRFRISSVTDDSKYMQAYVYSSGGFRHGWNVFVFDKTLFSTTTNESWDNDMAQVSIGAMPKAGMNTTIYIDRVGFNYSGRPVVIMTFDDGMPSVYNLAYPIMQERGLVGTAFVIPYRIESGLTSSMTLTELKELQAAGWDISSHGWSHISLTSLNQTQLTQELRGSHDWLVDNGFGKGAQVIAYRGGGYNQTVLDETAKYYTIGRCSLISYLEPHIQPDNSQGEQIALTQKSIYVVSDTATDPDFFNSSVDHCIAQGGMLIMMFHGFVENPEEQTVYEMSANNFTAICDYLHQKAQSDEIDVIPMSALNVPDNTPVLNKTVQISADGSVEKNTYPNETVATTLRRWVQRVQILIDREWK